MNFFIKKHFQKNVITTSKFNFFEFLAFFPTYSGCIFPADIAEKTCGITVLLSHTVAVLNVSKQ